MRKRDLILLITAILVAVVLTVHLMRNDVMSTANWGLSFRTEGTAPQGPASAQQLRKYDAAYIGNTNEKVLYTF